MEKTTKPHINHVTADGTELFLSISPVSGDKAAQRKALKATWSCERGQCKISSDSKEKSPPCQQLHAARMMRHSKQREEVSELEQDDEKQKIIIHTLGMGMTWTWSHWRKQAKREKKRKRLRETGWKNKGGGGERGKRKKNREKEIDNVNIPISKWDGEKASLRDRGKGCVVHMVRGKWEQLSQKQTQLP